MCPATLDDDLLLAIVHDCRTYLRRSLTGAQMLERQAGENLPSSARQLLSNVVSANRDMEQFLGRISDYANAAQPGSGRPIPLGAALQMAVQQFPSADVSLPNETAGAGQPVPRDFVRLFTELIDNGLKFSSGGIVTIRWGDANPPAAAVVEIVDRGIGIETGEEERVFKPLARLHSREAYPGFGLGLAICRLIGNAAGAGIALTANPAGGTIVQVTLPVMA